MFLFDLIFQRNWAKDFVFFQGSGAAAQAVLGAGGSIAETAISGAQQARKRRAYSHLSAPELDEWYYQRALLGDPEAVEYIMQAYPELLDYAEDPRLRQAQMQALEQLSRVGAEGFTPEDMAAIQAANLQAGTAARGAMEAESQSARMRGVGGSGLEAMRRGQAQQAGINRMFGQAADIGMAGRQRALQGMQAAGQLGTGIRGQEFGQAAQRSGVQQAIEAGNIQNRATIQQQNIANQMQANLANQQAKLALAEAKEREGERKMQLDIAKAEAGAGG